MSSCDPDSTDSLQLQVGAKKTSVVLSKLQPDTQYSVSVAAVHPSGLSRDVSSDGRTSKNIWMERGGLVGETPLTLLLCVTSCQNLWVESGTCRC